MKRKVFSRLLSELGRDRAPLIFSVIFSVISVLLSLYVPVVIGGAIDRMTKEGFEAGLIIKHLAAVAALALASALFRWIAESLNSSILAKTVASLRKKAYHKLSQLPVSYFDSNPKGDVMSRIMSDTDSVGNGLLLGMSQFFSGIVTIVGTLAFMLRINLKITALVVLLTPLSLAVAALIAKSTYKLFLEQSKKRAGETSFLTETLKNLKLIKSFVREDAVAEKFDETTDELAKASRRAIFASSLTNPATRFVGAVIYAAIGMFGAFTVIGGGLTVGGLTCFLSYAGQYSKPFNEISSVVSEIQGSIAAASRVFELIDEKEDPETGSRIFKDVRGNVSFNDVSFSYDKNKKLLKNVSFDVKTGQKIAIVGPTGCGKTTLINLIMRFYDPDSGAITVDGEDSKSYTKESLRDSIGMVLQDTFLFDATILENITVGAIGATREEAMEAAKLSHAHTFIKKLPDGYDTRLFEGGSALSEGERQLLSITRVMLSKPRILILDEATSSVDTRTEIKINDAFHRLMEGKTSFIVAHRISTVKNADLILVMKDGDIVETGRHDELIAHGGFYRELYESQFEA
ncbi:MAG: ABC transporter ATP-binding protein [Clostridia bacterium]|nr:ABC transporter ATP-binding protein [Clostridia bacterium]